MSDGVLVELLGGDDDPAETERLALSLRRELLEIDEVDSVSAASDGPAPDGTRAIDLAAIGALVIAVQPTLDLLDKVLRVVQGWFSLSGRSRTLRVTINGQSIELRATEEQQAVLFDQYLRAVAANEGTAPSAGAP